MMNIATINTRINNIFTSAREAVKSGNFEKMENLRKVLNEFVRDGVSSPEILRDFDGSMNYYYHLYHCI